MGSVNLKQISALLPFAFAHTCVRQRNWIPAPHSSFPRLVLRLILRRVLRSFNEEGSPAPHVTKEESGNPGFTVLFLWIHPAEPSKNTLDIS